MNFGIWEGYSIEEVKIKFGYGDEFNDWLENVNVKTCIPQGESILELNGRVMDKLNKILKSHKAIKVDETIGVVCHGATNRIILSNALNLKLENMWKIKQYSTAVNVINYSGDSTFVNLVNDTSHLENWWKNGKKGKS